MAYRSGTITDADPAARFIEQIEGAMNDHVGQWEFVEEVVIATIGYRVWRNRGSGVTNPNAFGSDFYLVIHRQTATDFRVKVFESWDAVNKKIIRPCRAANSLAVNANGSFGDEVNGYTADNTASVTYTGFTGLATTGFNFYVQATKDQLRIGIKQAALDDYFSLGVFESLLTANPAESFPLYLLQARGVATTNFSSTSVHYAWSRHPGVSAANLDNFKGAGANTSLTPLLGGIDAAATVDRFHNNSWILGRPSVQAFAGSGGAATYGLYRGLIYDAVLLGNNGSTARIGDTVTISGDVYVRMTNVNGTWWIKRDAV